MKLFSWFIKANSNSKAKQEQSALLKKVPLENTVYDEVHTFNNNTMWPIAKVKTTTMMIKKPSKAINSHHNIKKNKAKNSVEQPSFLSVTLGQE